MLPGVLSPVGGRLLPGQVAQSGAEGCAESIATTFAPAREKPVETADTW